MYGLPRDFDGSFFLGSTLEQICVSVNTMTFHFDRDILITVLDEYAFNETPDSTDLVVHELPAFHPDLMKLLEQTVSKISGSREGTLMLTFANGYRLAFYDNPQYEAYHIRHGQNQIIV